MNVAVAAQPLPGVSSAKETRRTRALLGVSGAALSVQVAATDFGPGHAGIAVVWFLLGCVLLWLVYRKRSRVARGLVVVTSMVGAVGYGLGALGDDAPAALLALLFLAQAVPLMSKTVRNHVQTKG